MLSYLFDNMDLWAEGLKNTVLLTFLGVIFGFFLAIPIAAGRLSSNRVIASISYAYVYIMRGTPLLVQIFIIYYGLGQFNSEIKQVGLWWFFRDAYYCGLTALVLNSAAYQSEIIRGGIMTIPTGVIEAGKSLGLKKLSIFRKLVMPITIGRMLPAFGNEVVLLLKASSLVSIITVRDVIGQARFLYAETLDLNVFYIAALNYLVIVLLIEALWRRLEGRNIWLQYSSGGN